jgi:hypothetical protein
VVALVASYGSSAGVSNFAASPPAGGSASWRNATSTASGPITASVGDTLVVKVSTGQPITTVTNITNAYTGTLSKGVVDSWTLAAYETAASGVAPIWLYVGTVVSGSVFNIQVDVTTTSGSAQTGNFFVERYSGVVRPSTWNAAAYPTPRTSSPFTQTFTTQLPGSIVTWCAADWNGRVTSYSGFTYSSSAVSTRYSLNSTAGGLDMYGAYQTVASPGATTIGYTKTTTGQSVTFVALELPSVAAVNTGQFLPFF